MKINVKLKNFDKIDGQRNRKHLQKSLSKQKREIQKFLSFLRDDEFSANTSKG